MTTFVRVVESGSFTAAAAQLGVSVSAVAKAVTRLEEELETQLLVRSTRKLAPNDEGRAFYARCQQILNDIEDAEASVKTARRSPKGRLRMAMPVLFGRLSFLPRVSELCAAGSGTPRPGPRAIELVDARRRRRRGTPDTRARALRRGRQAALRRLSADAAHPAEAARDDRFSRRDHAAAACFEITDKRFFPGVEHRRVFVGYHRPTS